MKNNNIIIWIKNNSRERILNRREKKIIKVINVDRIRLHDYQELYID